MKVQGFILILLLAVLAPSLLTGCSGHRDLTEKKEKNSQSAQNSTEVVFPDGFTVNVLIAKTPKEQEKGLMFVKYLPPERGMLFPMGYDAKHSFWMKNCFISLDMIWLDKNYTVADITKNAQPCSSEPCPYFTPDVPVRNVLEVNGGTADAHGLKKGDRLIVVNDSGGI